MMKKEYKTDLHEIKIIDTIKIGLDIDINEEEARLLTGNIRHAFKNIVYLLRTYSDGEEIISNLDKQQQETLESLSEDQRKLFEDQKKQFDEFIEEIVAQVNFLYGSTKERQIRGFNMFITKVLQEVIRELKIKNEI